MTPTESLLDALPEWTVDLAAVAEFTADRITTDRAIPLFAGLIHGLVGAGESGKSWLALHAALDVARSGHAVLIVDGEMSAPAVRTRLVELGATDDELGRIHYAGPAAPTSGGTVHADMIVTRCAELDVRLVVIDSAGSLLARVVQSENDNVAVTGVYDALRRIIADSPRALLVVDHTARAAGPVTPRGATAKFNSLDIQYGVTLADGAVPGTAADWTSTVTVEKDRHGLLDERFDVAALFHPLGGRALHIDLAVTCVRTNRLHTIPAVDRALARIRHLDPPPTSGNDAATRIGGKRALAQEAFKLWKDTQ